MRYRCLADCVGDLEKHGMLVRIPGELDPDQEMAEIHRRVHQAGGPAVYFENVKGSDFPAVSNLFGTPERARFLFRDSLDAVEKLVRIKAAPSCFFKHPLACASVPLTALRALPRRVRRGPVLAGKTSISRLPQIRCWPEDGGGYILFGQVYTEHPARPGIWNSNMGMYRVQMSGNDFAPDRELGLHYQIRRDIGIHHHAAVERGEPLRVSIFVGGPPAHSFAAVMYLPEGLSEAHFAGALAGGSFRYIRNAAAVLSADADFCITGYVCPGELKPEGPFGDHLGYYSNRHDFPLMHVEAVYHRRNAVWPFTVVGRPPQEDSILGKLVQEIAGPMMPVEIPGVRAVHAVDASGVHPLMLAVGSERYIPYQDREPREILAQAHAVLGYGPCALAKYLVIAAGEDDPSLDIHDVPAFLTHVLERIRWDRDLHFQTRATMDTLDYSGTALNQGSKVVMAAAGPQIRCLGKEIPADLHLLEGYGKPRLVMRGVIAVQAPPFPGYETAPAEMKLFAGALESLAEGDRFPLVLVADDSEFTAGSFSNFLWTTFTRSNPSHDIYGADSFTRFKHWGCRGPLIIDIRIKPHHAAPLVEDPAVVRRVEALAAPGGPLHGVF